MISSQLPTTVVNVFVNLTNFILSWNQSDVEQYQRSLCETLQSLSDVLCNKIAIPDGKKWAREKLSLLNADASGGNKSGYAVIKLNFWHNVEIFTHINSSHYIKTCALFLHHHRSSVSLNCFKEKKILVLG